MIKFDEKLTCMNCTVRGCTVLKNCDLRLLREVNSKRSWITVKKGNQIAGNRMFLQGVYVMASGVAKICQQGPKGREFIFRLVKEGDLFGYRMNSEETVSRLAVEAVEDCGVCYINKDDFEKVVNESKEVREQLMIFYHTELSELFARTCSLMEMNVRGRVAETLLYVMNAYSRFFRDNHTHRISLSRQELADLAGTTKEQVSRTISEFKTMGLISVSGRFIAVTNPDGLKRFTLAANN
jgi:CRP-like cAMP-binding protein